MAKPAKSRQQDWFRVDKQGLAKLIARKGKEFILYELCQNAWDENTTEVTIRLDRFVGAASGLALLEVEDDNPSGFANLTHAFTLFAESAKKANPEQRGRFNLGEKLVLALCEEAEVFSTKGTVVFDKNGRHETAKKRHRGTVFSATLKLTNPEFAQFEAAALRLLPPAGITTTFNGKILAPRPVLATIAASLPTVIGDAGGVLRPSVRKTRIEVLEPKSGEEPTLYELGIPVVGCDSRFDINVMQKVPLNMDRDNVTPSYLGKVRALVAEHMADRLTSEDANATWVRDAVTRHGDTMPKATIDRLTTLRFGAKRVAFDPSDPEANSLAVARGYTVVHGGALHKSEWEAVKRVGSILPAGQVTPSPKPFAEGGQDLKVMPEDKVTAGMRWFRDYAARLGQALLGRPVRVRLANDSQWRFMGCFGGQELTINIASPGVGKPWFEGPLGPINEFLIHEFGHFFCGNHLDEAYHDALCRLGGQLSQLALDHPELFRR